jgi:hypothetical protein
MPEIAYLLRKKTVGRSVFTSFYAVRTRYVLESQLPFAALRKAAKEPLLRAAALSSNLISTGRSSIVDGSGVASYPTGFKDRAQDERLCPFVTLG